MSKHELLEEFEKSFEKMQKELGFKSSFQDIEKIFFVKDAILKDGFVSDALSRQICSRISENLMNWNSYMYNLIFPNPSDMIMNSESKSLSQQERNDLWRLIRKAMELASRNTLVGLSKDKKREAEFIDDSVKFWNADFNPKMQEFLTKINSDWNKQS